MTGGLTRPTALVGGFAVAAFLVLAGLGWATFTALEAETGQQEATIRAERLGRERLALWRLDGFVLPVIARENARPFDDYNSATSPLPSESLPDWVKLHLQLDPATGWTTPIGTVDGADRLSELVGRLPPAVAVTRFMEVVAVDPVNRPTPSISPPVAYSRRLSDAKPEGVENEERDKIRKKEIAPPTPQPINDGPAYGRAVNPRTEPPPGTALLPTPDLTLRQQATDQSLSNTTPPAQIVPPAAPRAMRGASRQDERFSMRAEPEELKAKATPPPPGVHLGPMRAVWVTVADDRWLFLVRPVQVDRRRLFQAVWLDWTHLQTDLTDQVTDLLPAASLRSAPQPSVPERSMTTLPAELDPGPIRPVIVGWTPVRTGLALAWVATLLALAAVAAGGRVVLALADRRVRFVSAVTHELRTPLTSLRLYLDLLAGGMVTDADKQQEYLVTLSHEADRLHRLIENVLDFARLERRSVRANFVPVPVADLVAEVAATWGDRLAIDGKEFVVTSTLPTNQTLQTDRRMVGQILANLVDNARKYTRTAADPRVWLWARPGIHGRVVFEVEDRGPGVPERDRAGLFKAFRRGQDVEAVAGGAGLGLALAVQWSELLGGRLTYRPADGGVGACFRLELPASRC